MPRADWRGREKVTAEKANKESKGESLVGKK